MAIIQFDTAHLETIRDQMGSHHHVFESNGVIYILLAGSWIRGEQTELSDVDVFVSLPDYVEYSPEEKWNTISAINSVLYDILGQDKLDLSIIETLPLKVKFHVLNEGQIIWGKKDAYLSDKGDSITRYLDFKHFLDKFYAYRKKAREDMT